MAKVDQNVRIFGGEGDTLYLAPLGTTAPTTMAAPGVGYLDVGYFGESGIERVRDQSVEDFRAHQGGKIVRTKITESSEKITFKTIEENGVTTALGENITASVIATGVKTETLSTAGVIQIRAGVLDLFDGTYQERYIFPRLEISGGGTITWSKDNIVEREFTATVIGAYYKLTVSP